MQRVLENKHEIGHSRLCVLCACVCVRVCVYTKADILCVTLTCFYLLYSMHLSRLQLAFEHIVLQPSKKVKIECITCNSWASGCMHRRDTGRLTLKGTSESHFQRNYDLWVLTCVCVCVATTQIFKTSHFQLPASHIISSIMH